MRDRNVIVDASVCQNADALRDPAVETLADIKAYEHKDCPLIVPCNAGTLLGPNLRNCIPRMAQDVARFAAKPGASVESEMKDFRTAPVFAKMGFIDPYDNPDPDAVVTDHDEICGKVETWARVILNGDPPSLEEQVRNPHCARHETFTEGCNDCNFARMVILDETEVVLETHVGRVVSKRVPRNQCRCPILTVGDFCPVHGG